MGDVISWSLPMASQPKDHLWLRTKETRLDQTGVTFLKKSKKKEFDGFFLSTKEKGYGEVMVVTSPWRD